MTYITDGKIKLGYKDIEMLCLSLRNSLSENNLLNPIKSCKCYPIPRGGVPAAYALSSVFIIEIIDNPEDADFFFDDIIDSGATRQKWRDKYPGKPFLALIDKTKPESIPLTLSRLKLCWIIFPWESSAENSIKDNITRILQFVGEDVNREGLKETPNRVAKAWAYWCKGYNEDPKEVLKVFEDGASNYDQMVTVKDIPVYSKCEHHLADIFGTVTISYIPNGKIVGLSKLSRLVDVFARRLQVQERLTSQISEALMEHLNPLGVGVHIKARHMCMESRGICQQGHHTITTSLLGVIRDEPKARSEFMEMLK